MNHMAARSEFGTRFLLGPRVFRFKSFVLLLQGPNEGLNDST